MPPSSTRRWRRRLLACLTLAAYLAGSAQLLPAPAAGAASAPACSMGCDHHAGGMCCCTVAAHAVAPVCGAAFLPGGCGGGQDDGSGILSLPPHTVAPAAGSFAPDSAPMAPPAGPGGGHSVLLPLPDEPPRTA